MKTLLESTTNNGAITNTYLVKAEETQQSIIDFQIGEIYTKVTAQKESLLDSLKLTGAGDDVDSCASGVDEEEKLIINEVSNRTDEEKLTSISLSDEEKLTAIYLCNDYSNSAELNSIDIDQDR